MNSSNINELPISSLPLQQQQQEPRLVEDIDQRTRSQLINGLQYASSSGATQLNSKDISMDNPSPDPETRVDHIPSPKHVDFIEQGNEEEEDDDDLHTQPSRLDSLYDTIQRPLLISVLYFLFQLPLFKNILQQFKFLFLKDGNYNIYGYVFTAVLFGIVYNAILKIIPSGI